MVRSIIAAIMYTFSNACAHGVLVSSTAANRYYLGTKQADVMQVRPDSYRPCLLPIPIPRR